MVDWFEWLTLGNSIVIHCVWRPACDKLVFVFATLDTGGVLECKFSLSSLNTKYGHLRVLWVWVFWNFEIFSPLNSAWWGELTGSEKFQKSQRESGFRPEFFFKIHVFSLSNQIFSFASLPCLMPTNLKNLNRKVVFDLNIFSKIHVFLVITLIDGVEGSVCLPQGVYMKNIIEKTELFNLDFGCKTPLGSWFLKFFDSQKMPSLWAFYWCWKKFHPTFSSVWTHWTGRLKVQIVGELCTSAEGGTQ